MLRFMFYTMSMKKTNGAKSMMPQSEKLNPIQVLAEHYLKEHPLETTEAQLDRYINKMGEFILQNKVELELPDFNKDEFDKYMNRFKAQTFSDDEPQLEAIKLGEKRPHSLADIFGLSFAMILDNHVFSTDAAKIQQTKIWNKLDTENQPPQYYIDYIESLYYSYAEAYPSSTLEKLLNKFNDAKETAQTAMKEIDDIMDSLSGKWKTPEETVLSKIDPDSMSATASVSEIFFTQHMKEATKVDYCVYNPPAEPDALSSLSQASSSNANTPALSVIIPNGQPQLPNSNNEPNIPLLPSIAQNEPAQPNARPEEAPINVMKVACVITSLLAAIGIAALVLFPPVAVLPLIAVIAVTVLSTMGLIYSAIPLLYGDMNYAEKNQEVNSPNHNLPSQPLPAAELKHSTSSTEAASVQENVPEAERQTMNVS